MNLKCENTILTEVNQEVGLSEETDKVSLSITDNMGNQIKKIDVNLPHKVNKMKLLRVSNNSYNVVFLDNENRNVNVEINLSRPLLG